MTNLFPCLSAETTEELHPSVDDDEQHAAKTGTSDAEQGQVGVDPVVPGVVEPPAAGPTSPGGGAHDEGDPEDTSGGEEALGTAGVSILLQCNKKNYWFSSINVLIFLSDMIQ